MRNVLGLHGEQHDALMQNFVVVEVVQQGVRYPSWAAVRNTAYLAARVEAVMP
jgi:hypothetical protein